MERAMEATSSAREGIVGSLDSTMMACTDGKQLCESWSRLFERLVSDGVLLYSDFDAYRAFNEVS